ncbi:MAG: outer membrane protein transport protein [Micavibrio sp.]|nr:outer membrane protein transport protein [Micavibrio sp.]
MSIRVVIGMFCTLFALLPAQAQAFDSSYYIQEKEARDQYNLQNGNHRPSLVISPKTAVTFEAEPVMTRSMDGQAVTTALSSPATIQHSVQGAPAGIGATFSHKATDSLTLQGSYNFYAPAGYGTSQYLTGFSPYEFSPEGYGSSYSFAVGAKWQQTDKLSFRSGLQYDNTPAFSQQAAIDQHDGASYLAQLGASLNIANGAFVDVAASHLFFKDGMMGVAKNLSEDSGDAQLQLKGKAFSHDNTIKVAFKWKFK